MSFFNSPWARSYLPLVLLAILLVIGLRSLYNVMAETEDDEEPDEPEDLLWEFEKARAAGELSELEFQKIRASLLGGGTEKRSGRPRTTTPAPSTLTAVPPAPEEPVGPAVAGSIHEPSGPPDSPIDHAPGQPDEPELGPETGPSSHDV